MNSLFHGIAALALLFSLQKPPVPRDGLICWLRPDALNSALTDGEPIGVWPDASVAAQDAVQSDPLKQPSVWADAVGGYPAVQFDEAGARLTLPDLQLPYETSVFMVCYDQQQDLAGSVHHALLAADNSPYLPESDGYGISYTRSEWSGAMVTLGNETRLEYVSDIYTQYARNAWEILSFVKQGKTGRFYRDGYLRGDSELTRSSGSAWHVGYLLGGGLYGRDYRGAVAELIVYDRTLSESEQHQVQGYLSSKYAISVAGNAELRSSDPRFFHNGNLMWDGAYIDQPYIVQHSASNWLAVVTCSELAENGSDRHLKILRTTDAGQTWAESSVLEPQEELRQPSWGTLLKAPTGRIYCFYNLNRLPEEGEGILYVYRYSDDGGLSWSESRYELPVRETWHNHEYDAWWSWGIDPPEIAGTNAYIAFSKYGPTVDGRPGEGFVFKSSNILGETNAAAIRWEMFPTGDQGIAGDAFGPLQEEHNLETLGGDNLYCVFRTKDGVIGESYSSDGGVSWSEPDAVRDVTGREIKNPRACPMVWRCENGNYLLWLHNNDGRQTEERNKDRNPVWLSGGILTNGVIQWSQPEPALFTFRPPYNSGMSYPDLVERAGRYYITATDKKTARLCEIDGTLLSNLWNQAELSGVPAQGLVYDTATSNSIPAFLPNIGDAGFTVTCAGGLVSASSNLLWSARDGQGNGAAIVITTEGNAAFEYKDRYMDAPLRWETDGAVYENATVSFIVDGAANWIYPVVDGVLCDGGEARQFGWGPLPYQMSAMLDDAVVPSNAAQRVILHDRALSVSETLGMHPEIIFSSDGFEPPVYTNGPVTDATLLNGAFWVQWDPDGGNNSSPEYAVVQSEESFSGAQSLAIADTTNRVIARLSGLEITQSGTFFETACKSTATNDFGAATITLRFDSGTKRFIYNQLGGRPCWFDADNSTLRSDEVPFGEWHSIRIETDMQSRTYRVLVNHQEAFSGSFSATASRISSWEIDISATDPARAPQEPFAFFVDDLMIGTTQHEVK